MSKHNLQKHKIWRVDVKIKIKNITLVKMGGKCKCGGKCKNKRKPMMATQQPLPQPPRQGIGERFKWIT